MAFDREAAKAEGYTDDEINAFLQAEAQKQRKAPTPVVADVGEPPAPATRIPEVGTSAETVATTVGLGAAPYIVPAAGAAAAALGGSKLYGAWKSSADAAQALADAKMASEQGIAQRAAARQAMQTGAQVARPMGPISPTATYNVPTQTVPQVARPVVPIGATPTAPVAPTAAAPQAAAAGEASLLDKTTAMIRQMAANKVLGNIAKGGLGVAAMLTPGNIGQNYNFPTTGPFAGQEINPRTGRPWTQQELAQYR